MLAVSTAVESQIRFNSILSAMLLGGLISVLELKLDPFKVRKGGCFFQLDLSLEPALSNYRYMCILGANGSTTLHTCDT